MPTHIENQISKLSDIDQSLVTTIYEALPTFSRADKPKKIRHEYSVQALVLEIISIYQDCPALARELLPKIESVAHSSIQLIAELVMAPPAGIDVCGRNPKQELPQLQRLLFASQMSNQPVPIVIPSCPDTDQYVLKDGLGDVVPKALKYIQVINELFERHGIAAQFDIHLADVEGLDPVILANSGETCESHFQKTGETIRKTHQEIQLRGYQNAKVSSMHDQFTCKGMNYIHLQEQAAQCITTQPSSKIQAVVEKLLAERKRCGDFELIEAENQQALVIAELAGYAAYGELINGEAIILSPDAMSAIPAYHFTVEQPQQFSPVLYAK